MDADLRTLFVLEPPDTGALASFVSHRLFEAGIWESPRSSDGIEQVRVVECQPARLSVCTRIFHIDQTLHWFWLDLARANPGTKISWTLHFDFVHGPSRRDRDAIHLCHRADDITWRVSLTGEGEIRDGKLVVAPKEDASAPQ